MFLIQQLVLLFSVLFLVFATDPSSSETCISDPANDKRCIHRLYGTKTTYKNSRDLIKEVSTAQPINLENCQTVSLYVFKRHGIRYPDGEDIPDMEKTLNKIRDQVLIAASEGNTSLCDFDVESLRKWKINMNPEDDNLITRSGEQEIAEVGKNLREINVFNRSLISTSFSYHSCIS
jgi:hypothetical protein